MRSLSILSHVITLVVADFYNPRYDNFDVEPLLQNDRILLSYTKCFLEQGPCTPEAKDFKKVIPEALETACGKCTPKQKQLIRQVIKAVMKQQPASWSELVNKYDKTNKYRDAFNKFIEESE